MSEIPPSLLGIWHPVRAELDGEAAPDLIIERLELVFEADHYAVYFDGELSDAGTFEVRMKNGTALALLHGLSGTNEGKRIPAIYQIQGDRLRICYGLNEVPPDSFSTREGSARYLVTYRRATLAERRFP